jgi:hypothetical protein
MHDRDEEGRGDKIEAKAHEKDLFLHHALSCIAAISYCDQGKTLRTSHICSSVSL